MVMAMAMAMTMAMTMAMVMIMVIVMVMVMVMVMAFYYFAFLLRFRGVSGRFSGIPGRCGKVTGGSEWFRQVPVGFGWVPRFTYTHLKLAKKIILSHLSATKTRNLLSNLIGVTYIHFSLIHSSIDPLVTYPRHAD